MIRYYSQRGAELERNYERPERQADLSLLKQSVQTLVNGEAVFELAAGTGYWTQLISTVCKSMIALDASAEMLAIARTKKYSKNVSFVRGDVYALPILRQSVHAIVGGFWWSHIPRERLLQFLNGVHSIALPGSKVVWFDNRFVSGNNTDISRKDEYENTYQMRKLDDEQFEVIKNFPDEHEIRNAVGNVNEFSFQQSEYYWLASYRLFSHP